MNWWGYESSSIAWGCQVFTTLDDNCSRHMVWRRSCGNRRSTRCWCHKNRCWQCFFLLVSSTKHQSSFDHREFEPYPLWRCLPDSPKPVSPKPDSAKLGFRVRVGVSANWVSAKRVSANRDWTDLALATIVGEQYTKQWGWCARILAFRDNKPCGGKSSQAVD